VIVIERMQRQQVRAAQAQLLSEIRELTRRLDELRARHGYSTRRGTWQEVAEDLKTKKARYAEIEIKLKTQELAALRVHRIWLLAQLGAAATSWPQKPAPSMEIAEATTALRRYVEAADRENRLREAFESQLHRARALNHAEAEYFRLHAKYEQAKRLCEAIEERIGQIHVPYAVEVLDITVVERAAVPAHPSEPDWARTLLIGLLGGFLLGLLLASVMHWARRRL
jgi:uncharacterized protein involved in exopolysaccharide biosynthesis